MKSMKIMKEKNHCNSNFMSFMLFMVKIYNDSNMFDKCSKF